MFTWEDRKLGGILIEVITLESPFAVIGVGLNCQVDFSEAVSDVRSRAVSLHELAKLNVAEEYSPESVLIRILKQWEIMSKSRDRIRIISKRLEPIQFFGRTQVCVESAGRKFEGLCDGHFTRDGSLRIIDTNARLHTMIAGTILCSNRTRYLLSRNANGDKFGHGFRK